MKILVSLGPIIGVVIIYIYLYCIKIYYKISKIDKLNNIHKKFYLLLIALEIILIFTSILFPRVAGESYLLEDMTHGGIYVITPTTFKVSYKESKRDYSNRIKISKEELENIRVICSSDEGTVSLSIFQDHNEMTIDITNKDLLLDMSKFVEGNISFTLSNENAKNVNFELIW